jgi:hypothetical protein
MAQCLGCKQALSGSDVTLLALIMKNSRKLIAYQRICLEYNNLHYHPTVVVREMAEG